MPLDGKDRSRPVFGNPASSAADWPSRPRGMRGATYNRLMHPTRRRRERIGSEQASADRMWCLEACSSGL